MTRYFIIVLMFFALLLTSCALMQQPTASAVEVSQPSTEQSVAAAQSTMVAQQTPPAPTPASSVVPSPTPAAPSVAPVGQPVPFTSAPVTVSNSPSQSAAGSSDDSSMDRVERRRLKQQKFAATIDSLVMSHSFRFLPNSMQELPGGFTQLIYNELYFIGVFKDHVEVHMPTVRGNTVQYIEILNFDTFEVKNYQVSRTQFGWNISFNMISGSEMNFAVSLMVYNLTGEAVLNMLTLSNTVRYVGYIQPINKY